MDPAADSAERDNPTVDQSDKRFNNAERLEIIDRYKLIPNGTKANTVEWVKSKFRKPKFSRQALNYLLDNEERFRNAPGTKRKTLYNGAKDREGRYPEMEHHLEEFIDKFRAADIVV